MFKKLRSLFGLEQRLIADLQLKLTSTSGEIKDYCKANETRFNDYAKLIDKMGADFNKRMSRLEVLLEDELKAKELINIQKIKESRNNG